MDDDDYCYSNEVLVLLQPDLDSELPLFFAGGGIPAGFPSPADDYLEEALDLNKELIANPSTTFYARVQGHSMMDADIGDGDVLVIDRSIEPKTGCIAVCFVDGAFTIKKIRREHDCVWLLPANPNFKAIKVTEENDFMVWGVVTYVIKNVG